MTNALALTGQDYNAMLIAEILRARRSIWVAAFLFDIAFSRDVERNARRVACLLADAAKDGLDVRLLLPEPGPVSIAIANRATANYAAVLGVNVRIATRDRASHGKLAIFDASRCLVGGHNLTHSSLCQNEDVSVLVTDDDLGVLSSATHRFAHAWEHATPLQLGETPLEGVMWS